MSLYTHEEFTAYLDEAMKPGNDPLCCIVNEQRKCSFCNHPICEEHVFSQDFCKKCDAWLCYD